MKFQRVGRQLREVSLFRFPRARTKPAAELEMPPHAYSHLHKTGEMNHLGHYRCDSCATEMSLAADPADTARFRWECLGCGRMDDTSFRVCRCGLQTVLEKHAASARALPVSLNAGGCTECERCVACDGRLAIGNLKWFYGRWTHFYPDVEYDGRTKQQYVVTRERTKFYGFHCHFSCHDKDPKAVERILAGRTPDWYVQGLAEQERLEARRLRREGRCLTCRGRLGLVTRLLKQERHPRCC